MAEKKFFSSVAYGEPDELRAMLKADPKLVVLKNSTGQTALFAATDRGDVDGVKLLLEAGADVNIVDVNNTKPEAVKLLLAAGAKADHVLRDGETLLISALREGNFEVIQALMAARPDVNRANTEKWTPVFMATLNAKKCDENPERGIAILKLVLAANPNLNVFNDNDQTPLGYIAEWGEDVASQVIPMLVAKGADLNLSNKKGQTPLYLAVSNNQHTAIKALITAKADLNSADSLGWTPLYHATNWMDGTAMELLIAGGADVNITNSDGWSPLMTAAWHGKVDQVQLLLNAGADLSKRDKKENKGALDLADSKEVADLIRKMMP